MLPKCLKKRYICGAAAVLFSGLLFLVGIGAVRGSRGRQEAEIVVFGDSVLGEVRDETAVPTQLEKILGKTTYNAAFGGTCAARLEQESPLDYTRGMFSLVALAKAVEATDFGAQQSVFMRESNTEYYAEVIDGLEKIDFSRVKIFVIQQCLNDYHAGVPVDDPEDPYNEYTFLGALRVAVRSLKRVNPDARIVLVTPTFIWYPGDNATCQEVDYGGGLLEDYVNAEILFAGEAGIDVIDLFHEFFPHEQWEDWKLYSRDGMHPNEAGREKIALRLAECLKGF